MIAALNCDRDLHAEAGIRTWIRGSCDLDHMRPTSRSCRLCTQRRLSCALHTERSASWLEGIFQQRLRRGAIRIPERPLRLRRLGHIPIRALSRFWTAQGYSRRSEGARKKLVKGLPVTGRRTAGPGSKVLIERRWPRVSTTGREASSGRSSPIPFCVALLWLHNGRLPNVVVTSVPVSEFERRTLEPMQDGRFHCRSVGRGGFEPPPSAEARIPGRAVPLLRMGPPLLSDFPGRSAGLRAGFLRPTDQPGWCPCRMGRWELGICSDRVDGW